MFLVLFLMATAFLAWFVGGSVVATVLTVVAIGALELFLAYIEVDSAIKRFFLRWRWVPAGLGLYMVSQTIVGVPASWGLAGILHGVLFGFGLGVGRMLLPPEGTGKGWRLLAVAGLAVGGIALYQLKGWDVTAMPGGDLAAAYLHSAAQATKLAAVEQKAAGDRQWGAVVKSTPVYTEVKPGAEVVAQLKVGDQVRRAQLELIRLGQADYAKVAIPNADGGLLGAKEGWVDTSCFEWSEWGGEGRTLKAPTPPDPNTFRADFQPGQVITTGLLIEPGVQFRVTTTAPVVTGKTEYVIPPGSLLIRGKGESGQLIFTAKDQPGTIECQKVL